MKPERAGLYWGRSKATFEWYNLIIEVCGEAPMLYISAVYDRSDDKVYDARPDAVHFGPMIEIPEVPKADIRR